jgi:hypothetical protein
VYHLFGTLCEDQWTFDYKLCWLPLIAIKSPCHLKPSPRRAIFLQEQ